MSARDKLIEIVTSSPEWSGGDVVWSTSLIDAHRAEVLREAADKLTLELAPEQPGAGPGFLLALRLAVRAMRRMADEAAAS